MNNDINAADFLEETADLIQIHGHLKGEIGNEKKGYCAIGAMARLQGNHIGCWGTAIAALDKWVETHHPTRTINLERPWHRGVIAFNNHPDTTAEEVIDALKMTAKELRNESRAS